ncbi:MAG: PAS domain-containing protein [Gammaproteobacteria bacterium]|nr:PAS domain-containing protein [Gammaproteobacteria bacterium]
MQTENNNSENNLTANHKIINREFPFLDGHVIVTWLDQDGLFSQINQSLLDMSGYRETELVGVNYKLLKHPEIPDSVYEDLNNRLRAGKRWKGVIKYLRKDGCYFWGLTTILPILDQASASRYLCTVRKASRTQINAHIEQHALATG